MPRFVILYILLYFILLLVSLLCSEERQDPKTQEYKLTQATRGGNKYKETKDLTHGTWEMSRMTRRRCGNEQRKTKGLNTQRDNEGMRHSTAANTAHETVKVKQEAGRTHKDTDLTDWGDTGNMEHKKSTDAETKTLKMINNNEIKDYL